MKNYVLNLYNKASDWLDSFIGEEDWKIAVLVICTMLAAFCATVLVCFLLKELIWVLGIVAAIAAGIFIYCRIKGEKLG